ncbi:variable surface lipoprotein [Mycoplasmopsis bovis]|uniref:variable surface lipoprotein n=1 Tax=Mycoplasmopsis bovis TaxID=28903 RepID=UPI0024BA9FC4|nr:variable surface lipoprotein [Mycoplasmopsis bovis]WHO16834.1 variable surface lipoprotein [Mycoplasmopsis bovis]
MKKSKFLLLGSVASLASIPFVAAKCGETKEEEKKKPEGDQKPGGNTDPAKIQVKTQSQAKIQVKTQSQAKIQVKTQSQAKIQVKTQIPAKIQMEIIKQNLTKNQKKKLKKHTVKQLWNEY